MMIKDFIFKNKKIIIILILLFLIAFVIRAEAVTIGGVNSIDKSYYEDQNGLPYFSEIDSYYNLRMTQDFLNHGYLGDTKLKGDNWDLHSNFPPGSSAEYPPLISYLTSFIYKLANLFFNVNLETIAFWLAPFIASLAVIPSFFIVRRITNDYGGIAAALLIGLAPAYFSHTFAGFYDTDMFIVLMPLLIVLFFSLSVLHSESKKKIIFAILAAIFMFLFALSWDGWWYMFYIITFSTLVYLVLNKFLLDFNEKTTEKNRLINCFDKHPDLYVLLIFSILSLILIGLFMGLFELLNSLIDPISVNQLQNNLQASGYPNIYLSISELRIPSLTDIVVGVGGLVPFFFGIFGLFGLIWKFKVLKTTKEHQNQDNQKINRSHDNLSKTKKINYSDKQIKDYLFYLLLLSIWIILTAFAVTKGFRFIETFLVPMAISAGIFVGFIVNFVDKLFSKSSYQFVIMAVIIAIVAFAPLASDCLDLSEIVPGTDDSVMSSLQWINNNTSNDTIITSWWDLGHLFAYDADRPVTVDGSAQNSPRSYWIGKALLTDNETLSVGILRMLAANGESTSVILNNYTHNTTQSVDILNNILGLNKTQAITTLTTKYGFNLEQAKNIVTYSHSDNKYPQVLITTSSMVNQSGWWWTYYGSWNFSTGNGTQYHYYISKMTITDINNKTFLLDKNGVVSQINGYNVMAGITRENIDSYNSTELQEIQIELENGDDKLLIKPHKLIYINDNRTTEQIVSNSGLYSIIILNNSDNTFTSVLMNRELEDSIFTRLYFENGNGLKHFNYLNGQNGVKVWGIN
jgi:dolichyl-phosphooligosaccharide-protein glycotransferase